ncbi:MAG TPA: HDOD domain-containing protein, partial [Bacteroidota bacterium]|nr:HDOD domain-containing protein [Bacteroidota bacterium]
MDDPTIRTPNDLVKGAEKLSTVPFIFSRLNAAINSSRTSVGYISSIISQDSALTARLLRVVNSAFYGCPGRIDTISRAVIVVGTQQLRDLAVATTILNFFNHIPSRWVTLESFWKHSIACGIAARIIAGLGRASNVEKFFVAGILHDIGRLLMYQKIPGTADAIFEKASATGTFVTAVEQEIMGFDHAVAGGALVRAWQLPTNLQECVSYHHTPSRATRYPYEAAVVHVADILVEAL